MTGQCVSRTPLLCRLLGHKWQVWCANIAGHDSWRERRCLRCIDAGLIVTERQPLRYSGGAAGPWGERETGQIEP